MSNLNEEKDNTKELEELADMLSNISFKDRKNQIRQIINYEDNTTVGNEPLATFFANCTIALKDYVGDDNKFIESLNNSKELLKSLPSSNKYKEMINKLERNNPKSFIVVPILAKGHIFSSVIYKNNMGNYDIVVINKGDKGGHSKFEKYTISSKRLNDISEFYASMKYKANFFEHTLKIRTVDKSYEELKKYSINYEKLTDYGTRDQIVGNCYYKEIQEGIKYTYSNAYQVYEINGYQQVPKWPVSTKEFNKKLINNIKKCLEIKNKQCISKEGVDVYGNEICFIQHIIDIYEKNKDLRKFMTSIDSDLYEEKKKKIYEKFNVSENNFSDFREKILKYVDKRSFEENIGFYIDILKENNVYIPKGIMDYRYSIIPGSIVTRINYDIVRENDIEKIEFFEQNFPEIAKELNEKYIDKVNTILNINDKKIKFLVNSKTKKDISKKELKKYFNRYIGYKEKKQLINQLKKRNLDDEQKEIVRLMEEKIDNQNIKDEGKYNQFHKELTEHIGMLNDEIKKHHIKDKKILQEKKELEDRLALLEINEEIKITPDDLELIKIKEGILKRLNAEEELINDYDKYIEGNPDNIGIRKKKIELIIKFGNDKDIIGDCNAILQHNKDDIKTRRNRALEYAQKGKILTALEDYSLILNSKKYRDDDIYQTINLLKQTKEENEKVNKLKRQLKNILDEKTKSINKLRLKFTASERKKYTEVQKLSVEYFKITKEYDKTIEAYDRLIDTYLKNKKFVSVVNLRYEKAMFLRNIGKYNDALMETLRLSGMGVARDFRKVKTTIFGLRKNIVDSNKIILNKTSKPVLENINTETNKKINIERNM